ncbi:MAG: haloacid dehalogenase-like hydrolase [Planctomycetes bacterium]|nr:haloacid dehalogenase-like hydrolase [Planctomycetota bacterium]
MSKEFKHNVIAIVYDFDGTLTPQPMQEYTVLPEIGIKDGKKFWEQVNHESARTNGEAIVTYMRLMLEESQSRKFPVTAPMLGELAKNINYFPGVETYFKRINEYITKQYGRSIEVRHYVISAGLKEIISGTSIAGYFYKVFASEYYYNEYGAATFPNVVVNDTVKTQFIFRINKGKENLNENINLHMPMHLRPIPFQNILYIGDGLTDVPCMTVIRKNGGSAIAVYKPYSSQGKQICKQLLKAERVDFIARADYKGGTELDRLIKLLLGIMVEGIRYGKESFRQTRKYGL